MPTKSYRRAKEVADRKRRLLELLVWGRGWAEACKEIGIATSTAYDYRKRDKTFDEEVRRVLETDIHKERIAQSTSQVGVADPKKSFLLYYQSTCDRVAAAQTSGLTISQVEEFLNPDCESFDEDFFRRFEEIKKEHRYRIADNAVIMGVRDPSPSILRLLLDDKKEQAGNTNIFIGSLNIGEAEKYLGKKFRQPVIDTVSFRGLSGSGIRSSEDGRRDEEGGMPTPERERSLLPG